MQEIPETTVTPAGAISTGLILILLSLGIQYAPQLTNIYNNLNGTTMYAMPVSKTPITLNNTPTPSAE